MQNLISGSYFDKLLKGVNSEFCKKYNIEKIDIKVMRNLRQGMSYSFLQELIDIGIYSEIEISDSLARLKKLGIIEMSNEENIHSPDLKLTQKGVELCEQIKVEYDQANDILFKGMTSEQIETYKRLSQMVIDNINKDTDIKERNQKQ